MSAKTILIVDDAPENISILAEILSGYDIKVATNGAKALQIAEKFPNLDLILLDIIMPNMSGFEVAEKLKANSLTARIPIIFVTGQSDSASFIRGFEVGAEEYIIKPFDADEIINLVTQKLTGK